MIYFEVFFFGNECMSIIGRNCFYILFFFGNNAVNVKRKLSNLQSAKGFWTSKSFNGLTHSRCSRELYNVSTICAASQGPLSNRTFAGAFHNCKKERYL